jgi:hypothetical protein
MKRVALTTITIAVLLMPSALQARYRYFDSPYDLGPTVIVRGQVEYRDTILSCDGAVPLVRVRLGTVMSPLEQTYVVLGPRSIIDQSKIKLRAGDFIYVCGSFAYVYGIPSVIATRVVQGGYNLDLRSPYGVPLYPRWSKTYGTPPPPSNF